MNSLMGEITQVRNYLRIGLLSLFICIPQLSYSLTFALPGYGNNIVGELQLTEVERGDTFYQIARRFDIGYVELLAANPKINPNRLKAWSKILIPSAFVLPANVPHTGIIINLAELRLYYFPPYEGVVMTYPIGIGREGWETPVTQTTVYGKEELPIWTIPESIREHALKTKGRRLPEKIYPGPNNPLGEYAIRLTLPSYLIHGTNQPESVGKRSSSGCIRMYPEDVEELFAKVAVGTPVYIIHTPYKLGWFQRELYLEAHHPLPEYDQYQKDIPIYQQIHTAVKGWPVKLVDHLIIKTTKRHAGYPVYIGKGL